MSKLKFKSHCVTFKALPKGTYIKNISKNVIWLCMYICFHWTNGLTIQWFTRKHYEISRVKVFQRVVTFYWFLVILFHRKCLPHSMLHLIHFVRAHIEKTFLRTLCVNKCRIISVNGCVSPTRLHLKHSVKAHASRTLPRLLSEYVNEYGVISF